MKKRLQTVDLRTIMRITFIQLVLATGLSLMAYASDGQGVLDRRVALSAENAPLRSVLTQLEQKAGVKFMYSNRIVQPGQRVSLSAQNDPLAQVLDRLLGPMGIGYSVHENQVVLSKVPNPPVASAQPLSPLVAAVAPADVRVRGRVQDATGVGLPGVSVVAKGTTRGTTTNAEGAYQLDVPTGSNVLVFSSVGFVRQEVSVDNRTEINVTLSPDTQTLDEYVVVAYGTQKKSDLTGVVASVKGDKLLDRQPINVAQALQGRIPGVDVQLNSAAPGYQPRVRIRGVNSINSNVEPLYVVDGIIGVSNANLLNPNDIESVEVLKDASATAIYGARGANGVILITTKRGVKGQSQVSYNVFGSYSTPAKYLGGLTADEYMQVYNLGFANTAKYDPKGFADGKYKPNDPKNFPNLFDANGKPLYNTDWERLIYRPAFAQNHELSVRGGGEKSQFSLSLGYTDQNGLMRNSYFKRYSAKFTTDTEVKKWLSLGGSLLINRTLQRVSDDASGGLNVPRMVMEALPILPVKYPDGTWGRNKDWPGMEGGENPVRLTEERQTLNNGTQALGQIYTQLKFSPDLNLRTNFSFDALSQKATFTRAGT